MRIKRYLPVLVIILLSVSAATAAGKPASKWASFDSIKVHYNLAGNTKAKTALVFVHGWTCNADFWSESINAFPDRRVIAVDLPGHGKSDKPKTQYSMDYFARSIDAVLRNERVDRAVLVGHSMGTPVIRQFYRLYPAKTLGLVAVDGALTPMGPQEEVEKFFQPILTNYNEAAPKFVDEMLVPTRADLRARIKSSMLATPEHVGVSAMKGMIDPRVWIDDKINVPVLAVMAVSPFWPPDLETRNKAAAPKLTFRMWNGVSHFLMMEKPAEFNSEIRSFITSNKLL